MLQTEECVPIGRSVLLGDQISESVPREKFCDVVPMRDREVPSQIVPKQLLGNIYLAPVDVEQRDVQWCGWAKANSVPPLREVAPDNVINRRDRVKPGQREPRDSRRVNTGMSTPRLIVNLPLPAAASIPSGSAPPERGHRLGCG
jgi:hypothetical protein